MTKLTIILIICWLILAFICVVLVKMLKQKNTELKKYKNDAINARNQVTEIYKLMQEKDKINEWKKQEEQKTEEDVVSDIININNSKLQDNQN